MEVADNAAPALPPEQKEKVARIFRKCDEDNDGVLRKEELMAFMRAVNPCVDWTETQWRLIVDEVSERYMSLWKSGLTQRGLEKTYEDGYGDVDNDYETLFWGEQDHPVDYWQDADEEFWEDPVSSPDRVNASPINSPARGTDQPSGHHTRSAQQAAGHEWDAVSGVRPEHEVPASAEAGAQAEQASEEPQPASAAAHSDLPQDALDMADLVSKAEPSQQATAGEGLREQQQDTVNVEEVVRDPGHQVLAGKEHRKQPSDVPSAYPMIVHAGAVAGPPSRQTSSEFLASIAGAPQSLRPSRSAAPTAVQEAPPTRDSSMSGMQRSSALPTIRAQADQYPDAVITLETPADMSPGSAPGDASASKHESESATTQGASVTPAVVPPGPHAGDQAWTEAGQSAQPVLLEASPGSGGQPVTHVAASSPEAGPQAAITTFPAGEAVEAGECALSDGVRGGAPVSGAPALASIRTGLLPGSMARILADFASEEGQSGTPASHRISDVGSEEADEAVASLAARLADASSMSLPATPAAAHLTPRALSQSRSGQSSPGWGMHAALRILSERADLSTSPSGGLPAAGAVSMPGPGKSAAGSRLARQTCAGTDSAEAGAALAVGSASAKQQTSEGALMPDEAVQAPSMQDTDEAAAQGGAAPAVGDAALDEQQSEGRLMYDEAGAPSSEREKSEADTQGSGDAESVLVASKAPPCERDAQEGTMPDAAMATISTAQRAGAAALDEEGAEPAHGKGTAHAEQQASGKELVPDEALALMSTHLKAEADAQDEGVTQSALAESSAPADELKPEEVLVPDEAHAPASMQETAGSASPRGGGAQSAGRAEDAPAGYKGTGVEILPEEAMPVPSTEKVIHAAAQNAGLQQLNAAQVSSHAPKLSAGLEPAAHVSRKRDRPIDLQQLEETEKPARGSAARLKGPAHVIETPQGSSGLLAESAHFSVIASPQAAAPGLDTVSPGAAEALHGKAQVSAAERYGEAQGVSEMTHCGSSGKPALQGMPLAAPDVLVSDAANTPGLHTRPGGTQDILEGPAAVEQAAETRDVAPAESSAAAAPDSCVQNPQPRRRVDVRAHSADEREVSCTLQVPAHALGDRKLASAELLCDEVLPEADFGLPWHKAMEAASDSPAKASGRSRLGQPPSGPAATKAAGTADGLHAPKPEAAQTALDSTVVAEEAGAAQDAAVTALGCAQQEAQPSPQGAGVNSVAPEQDPSGQPSNEQPGMASGASPRIAAALLEAESRITVRGAKPRRTTVSAHSSAAAAPVQDRVGAGATADPAHIPEVIERVKAPNPIKVPLQPDVSGSPASTPTRQGLGSPIRFLSRALSSINPLRRGSEDRTPRGSAPPTPQGLAPHAGPTYPQLERLRPGPLRVDEASLAAADMAVQSHAVEVSPSPPTTAGMPSPDSRLPSPARPAQMQAPSSAASRQEPQSDTKHLPRIGREPAADAPAEQAVPVQGGLQRQAGPAGGAEPEQNTAGCNAAERPEMVGQGPRVHGPGTAADSEEAFVLGGQRKLAEADALRTVPLQAGRELTAQKGGAEVHAALEGASHASKEGIDQSTAPPAFWKSMDGLFAASASKAAAPLDPQRSPDKSEDPARAADSASLDDSVAAQGNTVHSAQPQFPHLSEHESALQREPTVMPQRPHAPPPTRLATLSAPSGVPDPQQPVAAAAPGSLAAVSSAGTSEGCEAVGMLSEAEVLQSPERTEAVRPAITVTSPFALAALQAHCGLDSRTAAAIEAAVMSPKRGPAALRQAATGRGPLPMSAASALERLQAELAKGDLPSPASPALEDLESLGRPVAKSPTPGRPPLSHATAETAVATLTESRFKAELQRGLEECKAELVDERRAASAPATTPKEACKAKPAGTHQAAKSKAQAQTEAETAGPADSGRPAMGGPVAAKDARQAEPPNRGQVAMGNAKAQSKAFGAEPADSGLSAKAVPMAAKEVPQAEPAGDSRAVTGASQAAATTLRLQPLEVPADSMFQALDTLSSSGRPLLQSSPATGRSPGSGGAPPRAGTPTPKSRISTPPLPPHKPPAAVRQSFFALPTAAGSPERPALGSRGSTHGSTPPQHPGHAQQRTPTRAMADGSSPRHQGPGTSPEASSRRATSEGADTPAGPAASGAPQASRGHQRAASASAADCLGLQTGMSLLDTQNLDELAGTSKQPAFQRAMSMLSTMGSLGTLACPVVPPAWGSDSEDEHSASSQAGSCATSDDSIASRAAGLASDRESEQARSAGAALEAGRVQREATASSAGADVRPVFMKALQILTGGRPAAEGKPTEGVLPPAPSCTEPAAAHHVSAPASAPAAPPKGADSRASSSQAALDSSTLAALHAESRSTAESEARRSSGGYRPRRLSAAAKPFVPGAPSPTDRAPAAAAAARSLSGVPWQSPAAPWMQKAASPAPALPQPAAALRYSSATAPANIQPQKPAVSSFEGPSRVAPEAGAGATLARAPVRALDALPGALSNADELASEGAVAGMEAGPSHNPCQRLDFGKAQSSQEDGIWGKLQALRDYHTASEEKEAQEIYEDLEAPILATYEVADIVEAVQSMQAPDKVPAALGGVKNAAGPLYFALTEAPPQEQQGLTGQQASLLSWFTGKLADVASEEQLHAQKSLPGQQPMAERESDWEAGSSSQGKRSRTGAALKVQQSEELSGMLDGKAAAKSRLLSSYSEMPTAPAVCQGQTGITCVPEGNGLLDTNTTVDAAVMATAVSLFPDPLQTANSEMLFNTMDPLSSINSTMNIHGTFEEGQGSLPWKQPAVRQQQKRSAPGDLLTTAVRVFDEDAASSRPASAAISAVARPDADAQIASIEQADEQEGEAAGSTDEEKFAEQKAGQSKAPGETLGSVLESAKQAVSRAAPGSSLSALEKLHGNIAQLSATDQFAAHMAIGSLLTTKGRHEEAEGSFKAAVRVNPTSARAFFHLGNVQFALQQYAAAETSFHTALKVIQLPGDTSLRPKIHVNLGITVEADGRLLAAGHHYQTALDYDPVHYRARKLLGSARYALGDLPAARDALQFALTQCPEYADAQCDLGCTLCAMNKVDEAKEHFEAAIRIMPNHLEALFNLANLQRQCGEFEAAVRSYERVLELSPDSWRGLLNYSVALMGLGRELEAKQALRRAFRLSGYSGKVAEEIEKLRRMAQRGDRQRLGTLMKDISQIVAEEVVDEQPGLKPRRLWGLRSPQRTSSKQLSIGTPGSNILDTGLLHQLRAVCALRPSELLNLTKNGALKDLQIQGVSMVAAETIIRRLLPQLPPLRFQHLMRVICHEILHHIQDDHPTREVDVGMMLALLAAVSRASCEERLAAAYRLLLWQSSCCLLLRRLAVAYVRLLKMCFGSKYNKHEDNKWAVEHFEDHAELSQADFAMLFSFPVFAALQEYGQDTTSQAST